MSLIEARTDLSGENHLSPEESYQETVWRRISEFIDPYIGYLEARGMTRAAISGTNFKFRSEDGANLRVVVGTSDVPGELFWAGLILEQPSEVEGHNFVVGTEVFPTNADPESHDHLHGPDEASYLKAGFILDALAGKEMGYPVIELRPITPVEVVLS